MYIEWAHICLFVLSWELDGLLFTIFGRERSSSKSYQLRFELKYEQFLKLLNDKKNEPIIVVAKRPPLGVGVHSVAFGCRDSN